MPIPPYVRRLREHVGPDLLMLPSVSGVVRNRTGEILLGQRRDTGCWALVSGIVDPGEQPADALVREIREETGVDAVVERLAGVALHPYTYPNGDICQFLNMWFSCRLVDGQARVNDDESLAVGWFGLDALPELDAYERRCIETAVAGGEAAWFVRPGEPADQPATARRA